MTWKKFYLKKKRNNADMNELNHIAFIMDGNGRYNKEKSRNFGHLKRRRHYKKIIKGSIKLKFLYFLCFFNRKLEKTKTEIKFLFKLIDSYFSKEIKSVIEQGVKINIIYEIKTI